MSLQSLKDVFREELRTIARLWFDLTRKEQFAILIVLGIVLVGAITRWWLGQ